MCGQNLLIVYSNNFYVVTHFNLSANAINKTNQSNCIIFCSTRGVKKAP